MSETTEPENSEKQEELLRVAAEAGDTQAMDKLGELLEDRGEIFEAEAWYRKAAELGNNSAMNDLGLMFEGRKEFTEAEHWFLLSANNGNVRGMNNLAIFYEDRGRPEEAESWYRKAGDLGFPAAVNNLGFLLSNQGRSDEAKEQYLKAINLGHENAMINLAITHANLGEVQDAERWYRKAVDLGNLQAMNNLALLLKDRGDLVEAEQLLHQGIALNSNKAMNNLAQMCIERGDLNEAEKWFLKSIEVENNTFAVNALAGLREEIAKSTASSVTSCSSCGAKRSSPDNSFCEECGTKFETNAEKTAIGNIEVDFDDELAVLDSLNEEDVLSFLAKHHHVYTSCNFCTELSTDDGSVIDEVLFRYQSANLLPPEKVVEELCGAVDLLNQGLRETDNYPPISELKKLTLLPACTAEIYEESIYALSPKLFSEAEWAFDDVVEFATERAPMPNAPIDFVLRVLKQFHDNIHPGNIDDCTDCQPVISRFGKRV